MTEPLKENQKFRLKVTDSVVESEEQESAAGEPKADAAEPQPRADEPKVASAGPATEEKSFLKMPLEEFLSTLDSSSPEEIESLLGLANERKAKLPAKLVKDFIKPLMAVPDGDRSALNVVAWWEARRMVFNLIVGACGLPTLLVLLFFHVSSAWFLLTGTIEYAIVANLCYTLGWMAELVTRAMFKEKSRHMGPMLLTLGLVFSVAITLACAVFLPLAFLAMAVGL